MEPTMPDILKLTACPRCFAPWTRESDATHPILVVDPDRDTWVAVRCPACGRDTPRDHPSAPPIRPLGQE